MNEKIDYAITVLAGKIVQSIKADEAIKYTQAALNLAHLKSQLMAVAQAEKVTGKKASG